MKDIEIERRYMLSAENVSVLEVEIVLDAITTTRVRKSNVEFAVRKK